MTTEVSNRSYIKKTALYDFHVALGGKIVEFAGWALPLQYQSILEEARHVRSGTGVFDISHMGEIFISGRDRVNFLEYLTTNRIGRLPEGKMLYTLCCNAEGGILDDIMVYHLGNSFMCVTNASNTDTILMHFLTQSKRFRVDIEDKSREFGMLSVQGKDAESVCSKVLQNDLSPMYFMETEKFKLDNRDLIVSRSGYTGEDGFEIYADNMAVRMLWHAIANNEEIKVLPCGLGARDILRMEMGYTLYGTDINASNTPFEASLEWAVDMEKEFLGKESLLKQKREGVRSRKAGFIMVDKGFPRHGYVVFSEHGTEIGEVRSGLYSPNLDKFIGTVFVRAEESKDNNVIYVAIRDKKHKARIEAFPFIQPKVRRKEPA